MTCFKFVLLVLQLLSLLVQHPLLAPRISSASQLSSLLTDMQWHIIQSVLVTSPLITES
jgi:hypothetical protein